MSVARLDAIFPYICFAYGAMMTVLFSMPSLVRLAERNAAVRFPAQWLEMWRAHRLLGFICLIVGALWILQNLWLA